MSGVLRGLSRESWAVIGLLVALLLTLALRGGPEEPERSYDLDSAQLEGLLALRTWLDEMGHPVTTTGREQFAIPPDAGLFFVYPAEWPYAPTHALDLKRWVEAGGTLVLVGNRDTELRDSFDVGAAGGLPMGRSVQAQPLFPAAPVHLEGRTDETISEIALRLDEARAVAVVTGPQGSPLVAVQPVGRGTVWHLAARFGLTNGELRDGDSAHIVLALLRTAQPGSVAVFDTYHMLGPEARATPGEITSLRAWLWGTPVGRGLLFSAAVLFLGLILSGIRLGPALPAVEDLRRREAAEHVSALAALLRRARQRGAVARHQRARLKSALARRVHLSVELPDEEFVARWSELDPEAALLAPRVGALLAALAADPGEAALVKRATEVDEIIAIL